SGRQRAVNSLTGSLARTRRACPYAAKGEGTKLPFDRCDSLGGICPRVAVTQLRSPCHGRRRSMKRRREAARTSGAGPMDSRQRELVIKKKVSCEKTRGEVLRLHD